ncbi:hypothetical protein GWK47_006201 [Chionoecetes opilio]|uniref:Uncharacterized protein n=1 Tax=Chionoecetes opilio TaxID=41210 RepID=A0A8J4YEP9_CHIOP|nr:hypothetical protein GWK47_006201 [Chionoecetes opilio]
MGSDILRPKREEDVLPSALMVSSLFNVVGFFRLLQFGVPVHRVYTHHTLTALLHHYQAERVYRAHKLFPWLVVSWVGTANLFTAQLPPDTTDIFNIDWNVPDENIAQAWQDLETVIASPKSLQQLCVLVVRLELGEAKGWDKLQASLKKLQAHTRLPEPILDLLHFRWVETSALQLSPPASARHLYVTEHVSASSASSDEDP